MPAPLRLLYAALAISVFYIWAFLAASCGFTLKHGKRDAIAKDFSAKMRRFMDAHRGHPGHETQGAFDAEMTELFQSRLKGGWLAFAVIMSALSASYYFVPLGLLNLETMCKRDTFTVKRSTVASDMGSQASGSDVSDWASENNPGMVVYFAMTLVATVCISFALQVLQHTLDNFFVVIQGHMTWLTAIMPQPDTTGDIGPVHEHLQVWWQLRQFVLKDKLPVLYDFVSPAFGTLLLVNSILALALVIEEFSRPGGWYSIPPLVVLTVHVAFISAFLCKSCWRLFTCATIPALHAVKLQQLKCGQLANFNLETSSPSAKQDALLFAEEIEAMISSIKFTPEGPQLLGVRVTPEKLLALVTYFASCLGPLIVRAELS